MKRITTILSLIAMMLGSSISFADDLNIFLNNHTDNGNSDSKKPQVLFLVDIVKVSDNPGSCDPWPEIDLGEVDQGDGTTTGCESATKLPPQEFQVRAGINHTDAASEGFVSFTGMFCTNGFGGHGEIDQTRSCPGGMKLNDPRPIIEEIIRKRPDAKIGVMALNNAKSAKLLIPVESRTDSEVNTAISTLNSNTADIMLNGSSIPTTGGFAKVYDYLKNGLTGNPSPLNANCENLQLVVLTNGGWKDDAAPNTSLLSGVDGAGATTDSTFLENVAAHLKAQGCGTANVLTSVIGLNVDTNDTTNAPLFKEVGDESPAMEVAEAGGGVFLNTSDGGEIVQKVLDMMDYSHPTPSALISPSAPVSISRSHNIDLLLATAFKPEGAVAWPGNMTMGTVAEWKAKTIDPQGYNLDNHDFTNSALVTPQAETGLTLKTDIGCETPKSALCDLTESDASFLDQEDIDWLKGTSATDMNELFGDPVHFKPLAIHYGDKDDQNDLSNDELYVLVGTNRGLLHMFEYQDNDGNTSLVHKWAFLPKDLETMIPALRNGNTAPAYNMVNHFYGVDGPPSVFIYDDDKDGKINDGSDTVLLYFGLRRGGSAYYALDITSPTAPKLKWVRGSSVADYGSHPDAAPKLLDYGEPTTETRTVPAKSGSPCSVLVAHSNEGFTSSNMMLGGKLNPTMIRGGAWADGYEETAITKPYTGETYGSYAFYTKGIGDANATKPAGTKMPVFTHKNQCHYDLPDEGEFTFEAHMLGTGSVTATEAIALKDRNGFRAIMGVGKNPKSTEVGESAVIAGFDISSLPDNVYITKAVLTFAHDESSMGHGFKQDDSIAETIYTNGIAVFAAKDGIYGTKQVLQAESTPNDYSDTAHYTYIGEINPPSSGTFEMGDRTTGGEIFEKKLFPQLYDGTNGDEYIHALTKLFNSNVTKSTRINDSDYDLAWVQFKIEAIDPAAGHFVSYGNPEPGELATNWMYNNGKSWNEEGFVDYWDMVVPKLTLTWRKTAPSDSTPGESNMSITKSEFLTRRSGGESDDYAISITINGAGTVSDGGANSCDGTCKFTYADTTEVTLTATGDLQSWGGDGSACATTGTGATCAVTPAEEGSVPEVTATFEEVACTPGNGTGQLLVASLDAAKGKVSVNGAVAVGSYSSTTLCPGSITITAEPESGYKFGNWNDDFASCSTASCTVTITETSDFDGSVTFVEDVIDSDGDGVLDGSDNCPNDSNTDQADADNDGIGDVCDPLTDRDGDGVADADDAFPDDPDESVDTDGDGVGDNGDNCPADGNKTVPGDCGCGVADTDGDGDGTPNCNDSCPVDGSKTEAGVCGCGVADTDSDGDGTPDCNDSCPNDGNKTEPGTCGCGVAEGTCNAVATCESGFVNSHINANRAWSQDVCTTEISGVCYVYTPTYYATGSNDNLGTNRYGTVSLQESSPGYWVEVASCP